MWAKERAVARTAFISALARRLRPAMSRTTRNPTPIFRKLDNSLTASILTAYGATMTQSCRHGEPFRAVWHLIK